MKKFTGVAVATLMVGSLIVGCNSGNKDLKTDVDSLTYAVGVTAGDMFKTNIDQVPGGDKKIDSIIAGFKAGMKGDVAYFYGVQFGLQAYSQLMQQTDSAKVDEDMLVAAFIKALKGDSTMTMTSEVAMEFQRNYQSPKKKAEALKSTAASADFLNANKAKAGVITTASGLQYEVIAEGKGDKAVATDMVKINYRGTLVDGTEFDKGEGVEFPVQGVVPGFSEALQLMTPGMKIKAVIPSELGYGDRQASELIKPNSILVFEIELIEVVKAKK